MSSLAILCKSCLPAPNLETDDRETEAEGNGDGDEGKVDINNEQVTETVQNTSKFMIKRLHCPWVKLDWIYTNFRQGAVTTPCTNWGGLGGGGQPLWSA